MNNKYTLEVVKEIQRLIFDAKSIGDNLDNYLVDSKDTKALSQIREIDRKHKRAWVLLSDIEWTLEEELRKVDF